MGHFTITIHAHTLDDALDIYGRVLSTKCSQHVGTRLESEINSETRVLSRDRIRSQKPLYIV